MIVGGETKVKKVKVEGATPRAPTPVAPKVNARLKTKGQGKVTKVDRKEREKPINLPSEIAPPKPAVTVTKQATKIVIAENGKTMKSKRLLPKPTMVNTSLTFRLMKRN